MRGRNWLIYSLMPVDMAPILPGKRIFGGMILQRLVIRFLLLIACVAGWAAAQEGTTMSPASSTPSLQPFAFQPLPLGAVKPAGWLARQLRIQADGLSGNLDLFWPDIKDSGWIGGKDEGWERMPYWLDGALPLAFLLDDAAIKERVTRYIDYILEHQQEDGWLGPEQSSSRSGNYKPRDPWPVFVMLKVLTQFHEVTGDARVLPAMQRFLRCLDAQLSERPLFDWNKFRWQDLVYCIHWLHDQTGEAWLLELADKAHAQGYDWLTHFSDLPIKKRVNLWTFESHVVNNAMAVKAPGVWFRQSGDAAHHALAANALAELDKYHGQATGLFTGDECFAGRMPSQGTELCAVVEYMFSLELLTAILGDSAFADRLERITFNALPATFKPDMWAHQYVQQANQAVCKVSPERIYGTNGPEANLFGLEPNYGCCTANLHQGWPKFTSHLWMRTPDDGLAAVAYAPSVARVKIGGANIEAVLETEYPFRDSLRFSVKTDKPVSFPLVLRVPAWTEGARLEMADGTKDSPTPGTWHRITREWSGTTQLVLTLPMPVHTERRFNDAVAISKGPLVFSLKVGEEWKKLRGDEPHADWEVFPVTPWNYALQLGSDTDAWIHFEEHTLGDCPFSPEGAPVAATVKGLQLPEWKLERDAAAPPPRSPVKAEGPATELTLIPYGCTNLRITEFPVAE